MRSLVDLRPSIPASPPFRIPYPPSQRHETLADQCLRFMSLCSFHPTSRPLPITGQEIPACLCDSLLIPSLPTPALALEPSALHPHLPPPYPLLCFNPLAGQEAVADQCLASVFPSSKRVAEDIQSCYYGREGLSLLNGSAERTHGLGVTTSWCVGGEGWLGLTRVQAREAGTRRGRGGGGWR